MSVTELPILNRLSPTFKSDLNTFFGSSLPTFTTQLNAELTRINTLGAGSYSAASITSLTIGTGDKSLIIGTSKGFVTGQYVAITDSADTGNYMRGSVKTYDATTGEFVVTVDAIGGSGTKTAWSVGLAINELFDATPAGSVIAFAASVPPPGYLKANGANISRSTYARLFAVVGTTYGAGDGDTTFTLPDLRGEFLRGWSDSRAGVDTGRVMGSAQSEGIVSHTHALGFGSNAAPQTTILPGTVPCPGVSGSFTTSAVGGTETRPRNVAVLYCIKY